MSTRKVPTTIYLSGDVYRRIEKLADDNSRSKGWIVDNALREYFQMPRVEKEARKENVHE